MTNQENDNLTLHEYLQQEAAIRGLSLSGLAHEIGINHRTLTATVKSKPRIGTLAKIARYLNINLMELNMRPIQRKDDSNCD